MGQQPEGTYRPSLRVLVAIGAAAIAVGLFVAPLGSVLLVGLVLVCPLMMVGMHRAGTRTGGRSGTPEDHMQAGAESDTHKKRMGKE